MRAVYLCAVAAALRPAPRTRRPTRLAAKKKKVKKNNMNLIKFLSKVQKMLSYCQIGSILMSQFFQLSLMNKQVIVWKVLII